MRKTFLVTVNEIGMSLRRRAFVLFAFGVPLILGIISRSENTTAHWSDGHSLSAQKG